MGTQKFSCKLILNPMTDKSTKTLRDMRMLNIEVTSEGLNKKEAKTEAAWELTRYIQLHGHVSIEDVPVRESRAKVSNQRILNQNSNRQNNTTNNQQSSSRYTANNNINLNQNNGNNVNNNNQNGAPVGNSINNNDVTNNGNN